MRPAATSPRRPSLRRPNRGPGWLNELIVLDEQGDQMLWYREDYGNDTADCGAVQAGALRTEIAPFAESGPARAPSC